MNYVYSAEKNLFYPVKLQKQYEDNGDWPSDAVAVDDSVFNQFTSYVAGKIRVSGDNGMPAWADTPAPTHEQLVAQAEQKRNLLRATAESEIAWRQDAVDRGKATAEEAAALLQWLDYRLDLMRADLSNPSWPTPPGERAT